MTTVSLQDRARVKSHGYRVARLSPSQPGWQLLDSDGASLMIGDHGCVAPTEWEAYAEGLSRIDQEGRTIARASAAPVASTLYAINARVSRVDSEGWESTTHLPTFYLDASVQGVTSEAGAERIVCAMLRDLGHTEVHVSAVDVSPMPASVESVKFDHPTYGPIPAAYDPPVSESVASCAERIAADLLSRPTDLGADTPRLYRLVRTAMGRIEDAARDSYTADAESISEGIIRAINARRGIVA